MSAQLDSVSDEALARMARNGDRAAFEVLCDRYLPSVCSRLRALLPPAAVEDVAQEVFLAALPAIRRYRGQSLFRTWIAAITRHKVADYYRRLGRRPEEVPLEGRGNEAVDSHSLEEHVLVRLALLRLPVHYQEVLLLRFAEGMSFGRIGGVLAISAEAAKSRCRRAVAAMAREMDVECKGRRDE